MSHVPEEPKLYVCENCQTTYAGTPISVSAGEYSFEPPRSCEACGESEFVALENWIPYNEQGWKKQS